MLPLCFLSGAAVCVCRMYTPFVGRRCSVVGCATCKRQIEGSIAGWAEFAVDAVVLGKAFTRACTLLPRSESGYLVGLRNLVCVITYVRQYLWLAGCMLPGELRSRWLINEQGPVTRGSGEQRLRWIPD